MDLFTVDAFSSKPFSGNPAAVCPLTSPLADASMQSIAMEMNLSETAFVSVRQEANTFTTSSVFDLRWFTPKCEVPLCGHATLATAAVLFNEYSNQNTELSFHTASGVLKASRDGDVISLDLPQARCVKQETLELSELIQATVGSLELADCEFAPSVGKLVLRLMDTATRTELENLRPSSQAMLAAHKGKVRGVIVTVKGTGEYDFLSRYFAPWVGIPEDPVTGSAHAVLAGYWSGVLDGRREMKARQCSSRGGDVVVKVMENDRVYVGGPAYILTRGRLRV